MKSRVLIIGPKYYHYLNACKHAFNELGWDTMVESYDNPVHPYTPLMKWQYKLSNNKAALQHKSRMAYAAYIEKRFEEIRPDVVFIMNGDILETATLDRFRQSAKILLWLFDNRDKIPNSIAHADHVDCLFCFEQDDVDWFLAQGKHAYFLPQACDTSTYFPVTSAKDIDILFVGVLYYSPRRQQIIHNLIHRFPHLRIVVFGTYKPWYKNPLKWLLREKRHIYKNRNIDSTEVNLYYNRSRIVLNIHQEQQQNGANPRTFEISGSGAYQLCDANPYIESLFTNGEIGVYHNEDELYRLVEEAMADDKAPQVQQAYNFVQAHHTFIVRIKEALAIAHITTNSI